MTMDVRRTQGVSVNKPKAVGVVRWFGSIKEEFKKISWTSKEELKAYTKVVVAATFVVGLGIYLVDLLAQGTLSGISALIRAVIS